MQKTASFGYAKKNGYCVIGLPYSGGELQFVVLLPDAVDGLASWRNDSRRDMLNACAKLTGVEIDLHLPKFKFEPPTVPSGGDAASARDENRF